MHLKGWKAFLDMDENNMNFMILIYKERRKKTMPKIIRNKKNEWKGDKKMNLRSKKGFGINEIIGIAAGVIIAAVVVIPGLRTFAQTIMSELTSWWSGISSSIFPA